MRKTRAAGGAAPAQPPLQRLAHARARERGVRWLLAAWCLAALVWLLPVATWTAPYLDPLLTMVIGSIFGFGCAVLVLLHRSASSTNAIRQALLGTPQTDGRVTVSRRRTPAAPLVASMLACSALATVATILLILPLAAGPPGRWMLHPLAVALLAFSWRLRGAFVGLALSVLLCVVAAWSPAAHDRISAVSGSVLGVTALADLAVLFATGWVLERRRRTGGHFSRRDPGRRARAPEAGAQADRSRFSALLHSASDIVLVVRADGVCCYASSSVRHVLGLDPRALTDTPFLSLIHPEDAERALGWHVASLSETGVRPPVDLRCRAGEGGWRQLEATFTNMIADPGIAGVVITARDITERRSYEERLARQALHDALTGLPNRTLLSERLGAALAQMGTDVRRTAVLFVDLDRFKEVNDSLGHAAGDALLMTIARRLEMCVRPSDTVARFGGDEFVVLLIGVSEAETKRIADRILAAVSRPVSIAGHGVFTAASIGITFGRSGESRADDLLRDADVALYQAKAAGRGCFIVFDPSMRAGVSEHLALESDLRRAVEEGGLSLLYQPEIDLANGAVVTVEALVQWRHPQRGVIAAVELMKLADETGLVAPVCRWLLRESCRQARAWRLPTRSETGPVVGVKLCARQLQQRDLVEQVHHALAEAGLPPSGLRLAVDERAVMEDMESAIGALTALRRLGVQLALDGFGVGAASLTALQRLPIDAVKVDASLVRMLGADDSAAVIVQAIAALASTRGMHVIAEGIDSAAQLDVVRDLHCSHGQGRLFAAPADAQALDDLLSGGHMVGAA